MPAQPHMTILFYPWNIEHQLQKVPVSVGQDDPIVPLLAQLCAYCFPQCIRVIWNKEKSLSPCRHTLQVYQSERGERTWTTHPKVPYTLKNKLFQILDAETLFGFPSIIECDIEAEFTMNSAHQRLICDNFARDINSQSPYGP